jgi:hypothetical protein
VAAILSCSRHGLDIPEVAGKRIIGKELQGGPAAIAPTAYYLKNSLGGYPIYASAISQLGLTLLGRDTAQFQCDAPTEAGRNLGLAVREWVSSTRYYQTYFNDVETSVPVAVIAEYAELICLCRLTDGPDHPLVQQAFLHGGEAAEADIRRMSLRFVCDLSDQTAAQTVSQWNFRQLVYYRSDDKGRSYQPSQPDLVPVARRWRLYQHREFVAWAYNRWLQQVSLRGLSMDGDRVPVQLSKVVASVDDADFASLASALGIDDPHITASQPLHSLLAWVRTAGRVAGDLDDRWDLTAPLSEARLVDHLWNLEQFGDDVTAAILALLALSAVRLWPREYEIRYAKDWALVRAGGTHRLSVQRLLNDMRDHARRNSSIGDTGRWFLEYYIIRQHHRVALGKLPDDTFRLRFDAGRVRFVDEPVAVEMNDPRYRALSISATELGWTQPLDAPQHYLSEVGRLLITTGDLSTPGRSADE